MQTMIYICLYRPSGEVAMRTTVPDIETADRLSAHLGFPYIEAGATLGTGYVKGDELVPFPEKPSTTAVWSWVTLSWEEQ